MRIFFTTTGGQLNEFYGKHRDDIESILKGIYQEVGDNLQTIVIFDGFNPNAPHNLTKYTDKHTFIIENGKVVFEDEQKVDVSASQLDWLTKAKVR